jgi:hypothetical protein
MTGRITRLYATLTAEQPAADAARAEEQSLVVRVAMLVEDESLTEDQHRGIARALAPALSSDIRVTAFLG